MRKSLSLIALTALSVIFATGCANTEQKFGRGLNNTFEAARLGEMRRSVEQTALFDSPEQGYTTGFFRGLNRSIARTCIGVYEMATAPLPPYGPVATRYLTPNPVYPDNFTPGLVEDSMFATDTELGFSGVDVAPMVPGSRFRIFDTH